MADLLRAGTRVEFDGANGVRRGFIAGMTEVDGEPGYVVTAISSYGTCFLRLSSVRPKAFTLPWEPAEWSGIFDILKRAETDFYGDCEVELSVKALCAEIRVALAGRNP